MFSTICGQPESISLVAALPMLPANLKYRTDTPEWCAANAIARLKNALAYCDYQAGRNSYFHERWSSERTWYVGGARLILDALNGKTERPGLLPALPALNAAPGDSPATLKLAEESRGWLVAQLMAADPIYTDKKLLSHLPRPKLARMLTAARAATGTQDRRRA